MESPVPAGPEGKTMTTLTVTSTAFAQGGMIPARYTGDGANASPPLAWSAPPAGTRSLAVICDDPDAPRGVWVHWVLYNLPPGETSLAEGMPKDAALPNGARQGSNDSRKVGYDGPAPPSGTHRYFYKVYALDAMLTPADGMTKAHLLQAMQGHVLAQGELMGKYSHW